MKAVAIVLGVLGVIGIGVAVVLQQQAAKAGRVATVLGEQAGASPGPWVVGTLGVVLLIVAIGLGVYAWSRRGEV